MGNRPPYASGCSGGGSRQRDVRISASVDAGCFQAPKHSMPKGYRRTMKRENAAECFCKVVGPRLAKQRTPQQSPGRKRSAERREGEEGGGKCRSRWWQDK